MHICKHFKQLWITLSRLPVWFYINYSSAAWPSLTIIHAHTRHRVFGSEVAIWLGTPPAAPVYQGTLIKPASKPPHPFCHLGLPPFRESEARARSSVTIANCYASKWRHYLSSSRFTSGSWLRVSFDGALHRWEGVVWLLELFMSLMSYFQKVHRGNGDLK